MTSASVPWFSSYLSRIIKHFFLLVDYSFLLAIDAEWRPWGQWSQCTATCGNGTQVRARACGEAKYGGDEVCHGDSSEVQECSVADCLSKFQHPLSHSTRRDRPPLSWNLVVTYYVSGLSINWFLKRHWQCVARLGPVVRMFNILREGFQLSGSGLRWTSFWGKRYMWWKSYRVQRVPNSSVSR